MGVVRTVNRLRGQIAALDGPAAPAAVGALIASLRPEPDATPLIRLGPVGDGGYLAPDDLDGLVACLSPGVSTEAGFDLAMAARGLDVHLADASVPGPPVEHPNFHFQRRHLDVVEGPGTIRLDAWSASVPDGDLIVQMDIEGAEWPVLLDAGAETLARCRILIVEFHDLHMMFTRFGLATMGAVFAKLLRSHRVAHIHPNNVRRARRFGGWDVPPLMEFTFHRRDRAQAAAQGAAPQRWPHPLDADCAPGKAPLPLPACWRP